MADALDDVMQAFEAIGRELDKPDFEPDAGRNDWDEHADALTELRRRLEDEVLAHLDEAMKVLATENPAAPGNLRTSIAYLTAELAAVHHAAGRKSAADVLFARALRVGPDDGAREELEAAAREPDVFLKLTHARWHHRASDFAAGDAILRAAKRAAGEPALERAIRKSLDGPRPMGGSAPALFRINGFGFGLYGERDRRPDGSYIATYALSALWVPVLAIGAYRVVSQGNRYGFLAKERLSTFAKGWNFAVLGAIVLAIGWGAIGSYLDSPSRRAGIALEEARAFEDAGEAERAAVAYQHVIDVWGSTGGNATAAAAGLMRVLTTRVEAPLTASRVDEAIRVARRYEGLPDYARGGEPATVLSTALGEWADQIGDEDDASRMAALRLVDLGAELTTGSEAGALRARSAALHVAIAESLREEWPSEALRHFVQAGTPEAMEAATPLVASLGPSTLADVDADVRAWERAAGEPAARHHVAQLRTTLETWEADAQRTLALETGDAELLASLHEQQPEDQEAGAALADAKRATGEVDEAIALLETYGTPGRMSSYAQRSLASCYADGGRLPEADALLTRLVDARLPAFQEAQQAFDAATQSRVESLVARARAGNAPSLNTRLEGVYDEARTQEIFDVWLREQIQADASLAEIRDAYGAQTTIVPTVLALGTLKLRRAHDATGDERQAFLADAERLFLAIRQEAAGVPAYHLSLGQVYHRLGRTEEGEAELRGLLESGDPEMSLQVAGVYRELGLIERARAVATDVYDNRASGGELSEQLRLGAAQMMALMATTLDDREMWLGRAPQDNPAIRNELLGVRAERALRERNPAEASQLYQRACAGDVMVACTSVGRLAEDREDWAEARRVYTASCQANDAVACTSLGLLFELGRGGAEEPARAAQLFDRGCTHGDLVGCVNLAVLAEDGRGVARDLPRALELSRRACEGGEMLGCNNLGLLHERGHGVPRNLANAAREFRRACEGDLQVGCVNLGVRLLEGRGGVDRDVARAVTLFQTACEADELYGCTRLGLLHRDGSGVRLDERRARQLFTRACDGGDLRGCNSLGHAMQNGLGGPTDVDGGARLFETACQRVLAEACTSYGVALLTGHGAPRHPGRARETFQRACERGDLLGCNNLGSLLETGRGVRRDPYEAVRLYQLACEGGEARACFNLGRAHERGLLGAAPNLAAAQGLYRRACEMGYTSACSREAAAPTE
ncbi:MAG: SEL1-like repeat protein [Myxococcales bacterium]|nr:SEL1-like repeat protein [Myxococcales bacterium]